MAKNDITVKLSKARVIGSAGFGVPLIIQGKANAAKDYAEYDSLDAVLEAGFTSDTPVYKQCAKLFIQEDRPNKVAICVGTGKVTETLNLIKAQDFRQIIPVFGTEDDTLKELATYVEATEDRMLFNRVGGKILSGLTRRRQEERVLFITSVHKEGWGKEDDRWRFYDNSGEYI